MLLLRRLRLLSPLSSRSCRCGRLSDIFGHHRASCAQAGVFGRRGFAVESAAARICREARGPVATNRFVRDLDIGVPVNDGRRLEVVVDGLPLYGGAQLAMALNRARKKKETTYPELVRPDSRARLVVLALEVGGRWSQEARTFVQLLAHARARSEQPLKRRRMEQAWRLRWFSVLSRAFAASLLELRGGHGADGQVPPAHEVESEQLYAGMCG